MKKRPLVVRSVSHKRFAALWGICALVLLLGCESDGSSATPTDTSADSVAETDTGGPPQNVDDCGFPLVVVPDGCDACHGAPPDDPLHPPNHRCFRCHGFTVDETFSFVQEELHGNGTVEVATGCTSCHGWDLGTSPPQNLSGECDRGARGVGAHIVLRRQVIPAHQVGCNNCHVVPAYTDDAAHLDGDGVVEVTFGALATHAGAQPEWNGTTCRNVYCHGATLTGGDHKEPAWTDTTGAPGRCGACHRLTDPDGNEDADCNACHPTTVAEDGTLLPFGTHVNGTIDLVDDAAR